MLLRHPLLAAMTAGLVGLLLVVVSPDAAARPADPRSMTGQLVPGAPPPPGLGTIPVAEPNGARDLDLVPPDRPGAPLVTQGPARVWSWPLAGQPVVLRAFEPPPNRYAAGHRGVDLSATVGEDVLAPTSGTVTFAGAVAGRGVLVIGTSEGLRTTVEPVTTTLAVGAAVARGQPVGTLTGEPGHCTPASCLHWGVLRGDTYLDPLALLGLRPVVLLPLG